MIDFSSKKRVVIKVGTSTLAHKTGNLNIRRVSKLIEVMSDIKNSGRDIVFVTSGAQGVGAAKAGLHTKPKDMPKKQACAAIGQCELMHIYDREFAKDTCYRNIPSIDNSLFTIARKLILAERTPV